MVNYNYMVLANNLTLNSEKSYYMIFFSKNQENHDLSLDLNVNNKCINRVHSSKFLGVTIDDQLKWGPHIQELCLTLRRFVGVFYKLSCKLPWLTLKMLYFAIIYPRILYGIEVYANQICMTSWCLIIDFCVSCNTGNRRRITLNCIYFTTPF